MPTNEEKLEALFQKVRALPPERQEQAAFALEEIVQDMYVLSDEELAILEPALDQAKRGECASDADVDEILSKPWS